MSHPHPPQPTTINHQRQFSPQQSPNLANAYQLPPTKRAKLSPGPSSNPNSPSPYPNYAASPRATTPAPTPNPNALPSPATVPHPTTISSYNTPYQQTNGRTASSGMSLNMPSNQPAQSAVSTPTAISPQPPTPGVSHAPAPYSTAKLAPVPQTSIMPPAPTHVTNMGPPAITTASYPSNDATRQSSKKIDDTYDATDILGGTGIDLDEEAELLNSMNNLDQYGRPGGADSFYGAGPANQPAQSTDAQTQEELAVEVADRTWNEAAARLARTRVQEITSNLLEPGVVHKKLHDMTQKFGLGLNLDVKSDGTRYMGRMANPVDFPKPEIIVSVKKGPDDVMVQTQGSFIPPDAFLVDQIALLSISTKQHLRELLSDANKVATLRQKTAHGVVPKEWADAAAEEPVEVNGDAGEAERTGVESAVSPHTNPLKRTADQLSNGTPWTVPESAPSHCLVETVNGLGKSARNAEEARLKKRLKREQQAAEKDKEANPEGTSRSGSVAPGTPGSMAPEQGDLKAPTKKESKKAAAAAAKLAEASSTTVNATLGLFAGGKKKKYSWMTAGGPGSGASTPRGGGGAPGTPGAAAGTSNRAARGPLTKAGVSHLGQLREDSDKGKNIQLRDWVVVLEEHGFDQQTLQQAYNILDQSAKNTVVQNTTS